MLRRTPLKRSSKPIPRRRAIRKGDEGKRDPRYRAWIGLLPCATCGRLATADWPNEAAHTNVFGSSGMSQKTNDRSCLPLCHKCHRINRDGYHPMGNEEAWAEKHGLDLKTLVEQLNRCYELAGLSTILFP